jgi:hypothetical protein
MISSSPSTVSSIFNPTVISGIEWPLRPGSTNNPPLFFQPLEELVKIRKRQQQQQHGASPLQLINIIDDNIPEIISQIHGCYAVSDDESYYFGQIAFATLLLGYGYTDECHNIITPLSWPDDIHFACTPSVYNKVSPSVRTYASYVHCLVHRKEAYNVGEFGMVGFANANFWSNAVNRSSGGGINGLNSLPHKQWKDAISNLSRDKNFANSPKVQSWCERNGFTATTTTKTNSERNDDSSYYFDSKIMHNLCATVLKDTNDDDAAADQDNDNIVFRNFAEKAVAIEVRVLLQNALTLSGLVSSISGNEDSTNNDVNEKHSVTSSAMIVVVNESIALQAMKKVSSAHISKFQSDGNVILRRIVVVKENNNQDDEEETMMVSAVAGIACHLLSVPACKLTNRRQPEEDYVIKYITPRILIKVALEATGDLEVGDVVASTVGDPYSATKYDVEETMSAKFRTFELEGCDCNSYPVRKEKVLFVDPLFGTRGETPTSVIQWSKGTIF